VHIPAPDNFQSRSLTTMTTLCPRDTVNDYHLISDAANFVSIKSFRVEDETPFNESNCWIIEYSKPVKDHNSVYNSGRALTSLRIHAQEAAQSCTVTSYKIPIPSFDYIFKEARNKCNEKSVPFGKFVFWTHGQDHNLQSSSNCRLPRVWLFR